MAKFTLDKYYEMLFDIDPVTNDFALEEDEYIRIVAKKSCKENDDVTIMKFFKTKTEIAEFVESHKFVFNIFIGLSTTKGQGGKAENMYKRKVLFFDFDRKDYPTYKEVKHFSYHIKKALPTLFYHMIVDTGHGFHYYVAVDSENHKRIVNDNAEMGKIIGTDVGALLSTQIARLPTTINLKDEDDKKPVSIVINNLETRPDKFKPYKLSTIERIINLDKQNKKILENLQPLPSRSFEKCTSYYCVEAMMAEGVEEGNRNFALGRITNYLRDIKGYTQSVSLKMVQEWNLRCKPPKPTNIIEQDFNSYWNGKYKLLGCRVPDEKHQKLINQFCDKSKCYSIFEETERGIVEAEDLMYDNNVLKNTYLRQLNGYHYMVLSVMDFYGKPINRRNLKNALTSRKGKLCISENTLREVLQTLIDKKFISYDENYKVYSIEEKANYGAGYTRYYYSAVTMLINRIISSKEYLVYLCLIRNLQQNKDVTYDTIADNLDMDKGNISGYIKGLYDAGVILIDKHYNEKGREYNIYRIVA